MTDGASTIFTRTEAADFHMSWGALPLDVRELAERVLTVKQLEAWQLELRGLGVRKIAARLEITKGAAADRLEAAYLKLRKAGVRQDEFGRWYVSEEVAA
jgi:predicted DNA-binding protein (UPF0251 family)